MDRQPLAYQGSPWMHCHPIYEFPFPVGPVNNTNILE